MSKRHLSWLCAVSCSLFGPAAFLSSAALACGAEETLLGSHRYSVDRPRLLRIDQNGTDLLVAVDNRTGTTLFNHPNDRSSFELVYLDPADGAAQTVCVHSAFRNPDIVTPYTVSEIDAASLDLPPLRRFIEAARLWATVDPQARTQANAEYAALAVLTPEEFPLAPVAGLYAIRASMFRNADAAALDAIDTFAPPAGLAPAAYVLHWYRGQTLLRLRRVPEAIDALTLALELAPAGLDNAEIRNLLGEALVGAGRIDDGERELDAAVAGAGSDHSLLAHIHNNRGYVLLRRAFAPNVEAADAERWLRASIDEHLVARAFAVNAADASEQVLIDNNLGTLYERVRELRKAHYHYREALRLSEQAGDPFTLQLLYRNLGALNQRLGDYPKSRGYLEQALVLAQQAGDPSAYRANCVLGTTQRLLGNIPQALAIHETCRNLAAGVPDYFALIEALAELSEDYLVAARSDAAAEASAWATISAARTLVDQHFPEVLSAGQLARIDPRATNLCTATRAVGSADSAAFNEQQLYLAARVLSRHALLAQRFAPGTNALEDLDLAASIVGPARYSGQLDILDAALRVYGAQGNLAFARECGAAAMALSERLHEDLEAERNGPAWSAKTHETYVALADLLLQQSTAQDDEPARAAFAVAERAMGISLRQHLSLAVTDAQQSEDAHLREVLNTLADENAALSAEQRAELLPVSYYHQHDLVELSRLKDQERVAIPAALDSMQIQARLREGETVLYYYIGAADAWLFTLDNRAFAAHRLGGAAELASLLATVEDDLRSPNGAPTAGLRDLSAFLLPASLQLPNARELVVVPHRDLYKIPFAALARAQGPSALIDDFAVKTTPSLTAYFMDKPAASSGHSTDIAVFADPVFNTADLRSVATGAAEQAELQTWSASLERLPYTELEADALKTLFQPEHTLDFTGNRATLANLADAPARNARILHIATHGYFHSTSSDNVGLVLSAINEDNERVPGFVTLTELFGHHFNNELVVISGCDTAMGMQLAGEGMMGLTRGFLAQGARHVISTLWPVSDRASAQFMALFYAKLHSGSSVAEALKTAQMELKALPDFRHPYYWAPYVLTSVSPVDAMSFGGDVASR
jgi:CHAT domain-containing protein/tetratricopeptide (TPR) repeat protein